MCVCVRARAGGFSIAHLAANTPTRTHACTRPNNQMFLSWFSQDTDGTSSATQNTEFFSLLRPVKSSSSRGCTSRPVRATRLRAVSAVALQRTTMGKTTPIYRATIPRWCDIFTFWLHANVLLCAHAPHPDTETEAPTQPHNHTTTHARPDTPNTHAHQRTMSFSLTHTRASTLTYTRAPLDSLKFVSQVCKCYTLNSHAHPRTASFSLSHTHTHTRTHTCTRTHIHAFTFRHFRICVAGVQVLQRGLPA